MAGAARQELVSFLISNESFCVLNFNFAYSAIIEIMPISQEELKISFI